MDWFDDAKCKGVSQDVFFLEGHAGPKESRERVAAARVYCNACPVKQKCLEYAIKNKEKHGIYGGATPVERHAMRGFIKKGSKISVVK